MFRISLDALLILDAIDRRGSFSAAGSELHRVPSTISYTVSKLEQDLGVQVFERQGPAGGGYITEPMGTISFVFVVAPKHPLAKVKRVLGKAELHPHRAISVADSARKMASRTVGLLFGQDTLTVPDMRSKYDLQLAGIGFGFLPEPCARAAIASGALIVKEVEEPKPDETFSLAWRTGEDGAALAWWIDRMRGSDVMARLIRHVPGAL